MAGYAVLGAAGYGASDFIGGIASRKAPIAAVLVLSQTASMTLMAAAAAFIPDTGIYSPDLLRGALAGFLVFAGIALVYAAFSKGDIGPSAALLGVFAALVPFLAAVAAGTRLGPMVGLGVAAAALAIVAFADGKAEDRSWVSLAYAVGAGVAFGSYQVVMSETRMSTGILPLLVAQLVVVVCSVVWFVVSHKAGADRPPGLALLAGTVEAAGSIAALWAVRTGNLAVVGVVLALAPAGSVVLARLVLGERMTARRAAGLVSATVSVVVLAGAV